MVKIKASDLRVGMVIQNKGKLWKITHTQHTKPGKGGAYIQTQLRDLKIGSKSDDRFRSAESVEKVMIKDYVCQFLFLENGQITFMHMNDFSQVTVPQSMLEEPIDFLEEDMKLSAQYVEDEVVALHLPETVKAKIRKTEPFVKGQTSTETHKEAILENGISVQVPTHIDDGQEIMVKTSDCTYAGLAKNK